MRVCVFVEGASEKQFFDAVVAPLVLDKNPRIFTIWSMNVDGVGKHESQKYIKLSRFIRTQICSDNSAIYSTMFDYYAFPKDMPGFTYTANPDPYIMVDERETGFRNALLAEEKLASFSDRIEFHPNLMLHEYETLMYCDLDKLMHLRDTNPAGIKRLKKEVEGCSNIELINDDPHKAPSKRIGKVIPSYDFQKTTNALNVMKSIGIETILDKCQHFRKWFDWLCEL